MSIHLNKPYKIVQYRHKQYESHYQFPADKALVVPVKPLGEEVSCDIRWENDNGELKVLHHVMILSTNLIPLNDFIDIKLMEIWQHYYNRETGNPANPGNGTLRSEN